jgi:tyrosinase
MQMSDPLFYLHHANLDRIWWKWQMMDPHARLHEISGRSSVDPPYRNVTLHFKLKSGTLAPVVPIRDVMNIMGPMLCYDYI